MAVPIAIGSAVALLTTLLATPLLRRLAHRLGVTDRPDAVLKPHARPTAYLGGVAFYLGWLAGLGATAVAASLLGGPGVSRSVWTIAALGGAMLLVGLIDDIRSVSPKLRMLLEVALAIGLYIGGVRFLAVPGAEPGSTTSLVIGLLLQIGAVAGACNATNLLDGLDGLAGGVLAIVLAAMATLAGVYMAVRGADASGRLTDLLLLAPPLVAALVGFLRYNYRPASIFMGDAGSLLLGFVVAACLVLLAGPGLKGLTLAMGGLFIFGVPLVDTALAFYRRKKNGRPIFAGDRSHLYDQLVDRGLPVVRVVNLCYLMAVGFAVVAIAVTVAVGRFFVDLAIFLAILAGVALALKLGGFVRVDRPAPPADH